MCEAPALSSQKQVYVAGTGLALSMLYLLLKKCKLCRIKEFLFLIHKVFLLQSFILGLFFKQASSNVIAFNGTNLWLGVSALIDLCEAVIVDRLVSC